MPVQSAARHNAVTGTTIPHGASKSIRPVARPEPPVPSMPTDRALPAAISHASLTLPAVKMFRRILLVLGVAGAVGAIARVRGKGEVPTTEGGWRELDGPEFR